MKIYFNKVWHDDSCSGPLVNKALFFGESLFTTTRITRGHIAFLDDHLKRLEKGHMFLFSKELSTSKLKEELLTALNELDLFEGDCSLRISFFQTFDLNVHYFFTVKEIDEVTSLNLRFSKTISGKSCLPNFLKAGSYLETLNERKEAALDGYDDIIFRNHNGEVLDSSFANVFIVKDGVIKVSSLKPGILSGVMRNYLLDFLKRKKISYEICHLMESDFKSCSEVWLTNSLRFLLCASSFEGRELDSTVFKKVEREVLLELENLK